MIATLLAGLMFVSPADGGGGVPAQGAIPYASFPGAMYGGLDNYPAEVKAGSIFHVKGHATDTDTYKLINNNLVQYDSTDHVFLALTITSGTVLGSTLVGTKPGGERDYDIVIEAISAAQLNGDPYVMRTDTFKTHDNWYNENCILHNLLQDPEGGPYGYMVKVSVNGPGG